MGNPSANKEASMDKPDFKYGAAPLEDKTVCKLLQVIASVCPRDFVLIELQANLVKETREKLLSKFPSFMFKKVALVAMGSPSDAFVKYNEKLMLQDKQAAS